MEHFINYLFAINKKIGQKIGKNNFQSEKSTVIKIVRINIIINSLVNT